jgi:hypothetical protein
MASNFVGVATPTLIYVGVADRDEFDKIAGPVSDSGPSADGNHVITKMVQQDKTKAIFQHWIKFELPKIAPAA